MAASSESPSGSPSTPADRQDGAASVRKVKIERGIPIPAHREYNGKYQFGKMDIGDSVFIRGVKKGQLLATAARVWGTRHGCKFLQRQIDGGVRVWRTK